MIKKIRRMWTCPDCKRSFKTKQFTHSCVAFASHFTGHKLINFKIYNKLIDGDTRQLINESEIKAKKHLLLA